MIEVPSFHIDVPVLVLVVAIVIAWVVVTLRSPPITRGPDEKGRS